jgi:anti-anti-sigma factor
MTALPELRYSWETSDVHIGRISLSGDLTHVNADDLLQAVTDQMGAHPALRELHVDCAGLDVCDSRGLSVLLMLRRRSESLGIELRVVNRPTTLDRMLDRTGTAEYLIGDDVGDSMRGEPSG